MLVKTYFDENDRLRVLEAPGSGVKGELLAGFIRSDIQDDDTLAREVLAHLDSVQNLREAEWTQSGNAYFITVKPKEVVLHLMYGDKGTVRLSLEEVREAVGAWLVALELDRTISGLPQ